MPLKWWRVGVTTINLDLVEYANYVAGIPPGHEPKLVLKMTNEQTVTVKGDAADRLDAYFKGLCEWPKPEAEG